MLKAFLRALTSPFVFRKYKDIWGLKLHLLALKRQKKTNRLLSSIYKNYFYEHGSYVGLLCQLADAPCMPHGPLGIFIADGAQLGKHVIIFQHVTIGSDNLIDSENQGSPVIGDDVYIGAGAKIIGNIRIGNNCRIGANAVVYTDMPDNSVAVCAATRVIQKQDLDNRFMVPSNEAGWLICENSQYRALTDEEMQQYRK